MADTPDEPDDRETRARRAQAEDAGPTDSGSIIGRMLDDFDTDPEADPIPDAGRPQTCHGYAPKDPRAAAALDAIRAADRPGSTLAATLDRAGFPTDPRPAELAALDLDPDDAAELGEFDFPPRDGMEREDYARAYGPRAAAAVYGPDPDDDPTGPEPAADLDPADNPSDPPRFIRETRRPLYLVPISRPDPAERTAAALDAAAGNVREIRRAIAALAFDLFAKMMKVDASFDDFHGNPFDPKNPDAGPKVSDQ